MLKRNIALLREFDAYSLYDPYCSHFKYIHHWLLTQMNNGKIMSSTFEDTNIDYTSHAH